MLSRLRQWLFSWAIEHLGETATVRFLEAMDAIGCWWRRYGLWWGRDD